MLQFIGSYHLPYFESIRDHCHYSGVSIGKKVEYDKERKYNEEEEEKKRMRKKKKRRREERGDKENV